MNYKSELHKERVEKRDSEIEERSCLNSIRLSMRIHAMKMKERATKILKKYGQRKTNGR